MNLKDFISKTASDALGRIIASAPQKFMSLITSSIWVETKIDRALYFHLKNLLDDTAIVVWSPAVKYSLINRRLGKGDFKIHTERDDILYIVGVRVPIRIRYSDDSCYVAHPRRFNVERLLKKAILSQDCMTERSIWRIEFSSSGSMSYHHTATIQKMFHWKSPALQMLIEGADRWSKSEEVCAKKNLPWRHGWLLYGDPGNGKSTAAIILARHLGLHLYLINLNIEEHQFVRLWIDLQKMTPCIVLIEDIDDIFELRKNIKMPEKGLSFSTFINCISGVDSGNGMIIIVTTNKVASIDPALGRPLEENGHWNQKSTRPGRLDRCIRFDNPNFSERLEIAKMLLPDQQAEALADQMADTSVAQFMEVCRERAFSRLEEDLKLDASGIFPQEEP